MSEPVVTCPFCAENIQPAALVCCHCGRETQPPRALIEERDELAAKLAAMRLRLEAARHAEAASRRRRRIRHPA